MKTLLKKTALGGALAATLLGMAVQPAEAQRYGYRGGGGYHGGYRGGGAVAAGVVGLAVGAAMAGGINGRYAYYNRYYDGRYAGDWNYYRARGYYPMNGYYWNYYAQRGWRGCDIRPVWDPYLGYAVPVRYCF